jgi:hypothetical protein
MYFYANYIRKLYNEKIEDIRPTAELSPEIIKTICDAISQEFYSWELKGNDDDNGRFLR